MPTATQEQRLTELRENLDRVRADQEIRLYESQLGMAAHVEHMLETQDAFAYSDPTRRGLTAPGSFDRFYGGRPDDYRGGKCWPLYETEMDLQELRSIGRWVSAWDETGIAVTTNLRNYTIGDGFMKEAKPRDKSSEAAQMTAEVQAFIDDFDDANDWLDEGESEAFLSAISDGEQLLWLKHRGTDAPRVRFVGGEFITEPANPAMIEDHFGLPSLCWKFGVATEHGNQSKVYGYFVQWDEGSQDPNGESTNWDFIPASEAVFIKRNTPRPAKRGVGDFGVLWGTLDKGAKLFGNIVTGATGQASIMYIRKMLQQTPGDALAGFPASPLSGRGMAYNANGQPTSVPTERVPGGRIISTPGDYMYGPMGSPQGPLFMGILDGIARRVGATKGMPEYMISGNASNANYSSTMVAESPFVQNTKKEQGRHGRRSRELLWKAVDMAARHGRFGGRTVQEIKRLVEISVEGPDPVSRDPVALETVRDKQQAAGVLSRKTRAQQSDLDFEEEVANGAKEAAPVALPGQQTNPVSESRILDLTWSLLEGSE